MGFDFVSFFPRAVMQGIPLLYGSTGEILTEKSGNLNLGIPGIMYVGGICGVIGAFFYEQSTPAADMNAFLAIGIPMLCSLLGSLLMGLLYCLLTVTLRANQNVTGLALTTFGVGIGNFFGGSLSVGIDRYRNLGDQGDNGVYVIDGWEIVDRYTTDYDKDWNAIGLRHIDLSAEQSGYDFNEMLHAFDEAMPENLRLGDFLDADEVPVSDVRLGDKVWMSAYESGPELFEVVGFGADDAPRGLKGIPFVNRYDHDGDYSWNCNNYLREEAYRIAPAA